MNFRARRAWLLAALTLMLIGRSAEAAPRVVLIARTSSSTAPAPDMAPAQIEAELRAAGYEVIRASAQDAAMDDLRRAAESREAIAAIGVAGTAEQPVADVWVTDRTLGKTVIRRVTAEGATDDAPRVLALEVVETLHASLVEIGSIPASEAPAAPPAAPVTSPPPPPPANPPTRRIAPRRQPDRGAPTPPRPTESRHDPLRVALGVGMLGGAGDLPWITPSLAASAGYRFTERWSAEVSWLGPAMSRVSARESQGNAHANVDQELVSARLGISPNPSSVEPFAAIGAGVERIAASGSIDDQTGAPAYRGGSTTAWFPFAEIAVGARWHMTHGIALVGSAAAGATAARPVLRFGTETRTTQLPLVSVTASAEASW